MRARRSPRFAGVIAGLVCAVAAAVSGCQPADGGATPAAQAVRTPGTVAIPAAARPTPQRHAKPAAKPHRRRVSATGVVLIAGGHIVLPNRQRTPGAGNP